MAILRRSSPTNLTLHAWAKRITERRGQRVAVVALARKLAGILYVMWRDGTSFEPNPSRSDKREMVPA